MLRAELPPERVERLRKYHREWARAFRARRTPEQKAKAKELDRVYKARPEVKVRCKLAKLKHDRKPESQRKRHDRKLRKFYGKDAPALFDRLLIASCGCCALCEFQFSNKHCEPCMDHDHDTGRVRGLLCHRCNRSLMPLERYGIRWLKNTLAYLQLNT